MYGYSSASIHQTRTVWCYYSDKVYLYQLMVKSVIFYTLRELSAIVNEMLLLMAGDVESNPGPREYWRFFLRVLVLCVYGSVEGRRGRGIGIGNVMWLAS